jgi:hypothetical protein
MSDPVSATVTTENGTIGPFFLSGKAEADVAIAVTAGTADLQRKIDEATGFVSVSTYDASQSLVIEGAGTWQVLCTGTPNITATFRSR